MRSFPAKALILAAVLLITLAFIGLSGCAKSGDSEKNDKTPLVIWGMGVEGEKLKDMVELFKQENPSAEVSIQSIPWGQAHEKLITAVAGGNAPDLAQFGTTWIPEFVALGSLEPLDSMISGSQALGEQNYFPGSWKTSLIEGKIYGIPWYVDTRVLFYRSDLLKEIGLDRAPHDWTELKDVCRKLTKKDANGEYTRRGITLPAVDWMVLAMFMWSNGGDILSEDGKNVINSPENREALDFYASFFKEGLAPLASKGGVELYNAFKSGYIPMFIGGSWQLEDMRVHAPEIQGRWNVAVLPMKKSSTSFVGGSNWCVFNTSKKKELAWKFVEFMSRPDIQVKWYQLTTDLPTRTEAWENDFFKDKPMIKVFGSQLSDTKSPPRLQKWEEMSVKINTQMEKAVFGKVTAAEALGAMEKDINDVISRGR
jgi:multiple sugar transport system substrate-binding protein